MKPMFKYSGGKSRELKHIKPLLPPLSEIKRIVEPFCGGGALSFHLEKPSLLADVRENVTNFYQIMQSSTNFSEMLSKIAIWKTLSVEERERLYYYYRDELFGNNKKFTQAYRWLFLRQQTFSGMDRVNGKTGKINSPFGWYKTFPCNINEEHHKFLQNCEVVNQSFVKTLKSCRDGDFIFIDPPYLDRNSDYGLEKGKHNIELHEELANILVETQHKWLIIHPDCDFYREAYAGFEVKEVDFRYAQNFKGRDSSKSAVKHLYISNFK